MGENNNNLNHIKIIVKELTDTTNILNNIVNKFLSQVEKMLIVLSETSKDISFSLTTGKANQEEMRDNVRDIYQIIQKLSLKLEPLKESLTEVKESFTSINKYMSKLNEHNINFQNRINSIVKQNTKSNILTTILYIIFASILSALSIIGFKIGEIMEILKQLKH